MRLLRRGWAARLADLPVVLRLFVVVAVALALARPQTPQKDDDLELEGIDIVSRSTCPAPWKKPICSPIVWKRPRP